MRRGVLIAIEGIDGSGKSTFIKQIEKRYGSEIVMTVQSGGKDPNDVERYIKAIVTDEKKAMENQTESLLYLAGLAHKTQHHIIPALEQYKMVVVDRYILSSFVHSHFMDNTDVAISKSIIEFATGGIVPDLTFLCDIDVAVAYNRILNRGNQLTKREKKGQQFYETLRDGYKKYVTEFSAEHVIIDTKETTIDGLDSYLSILDRYV